MERNFKLVEIFADFLNTKELKKLRSPVLSIMQAGVSDEEALRILIAESEGVDCAGKDKEFFNKYFPLCLKKLDSSPYLNDEYLKKISFGDIKSGDCKLFYDSYAPYEPFVFDDIYSFFDGTLIPKIGFFENKFSFPAISENGNIWMTVTPNEINTMQPLIQKAFGKITLLGLGLGYFAFHAALSDKVEKIMVIEKNKSIIDLYDGFLKKQFLSAEKISIIEGDAYELVEKGKLPESDFVFCDLWRDVSDGVIGYKRLKKAEKNYPNTKFTYWIEKSIKFYL